MFVSNSRFAREESLDQEEGNEPERELSYLDGEGDDRGKKRGEAVRKREKEQGSQEKVKRRERHPEKSILVFA